MAVPVLIRAAAINTDSKIDAADFTQSPGSHSHILVFFTLPLLLYSLPPFSFPFPSPTSVPTISPSNVQVEAVNSTAIRFTWRPPNPQFINGINQGYKVSNSPVLQQLAIASIDRTVRAELVSSHAVSGREKASGQTIFVDDESNGLGLSI